MGMATIKPNDNAPDEEVRYLLANADLKLKAGGSYDTDDAAVIASAEAHPWLEVEYPAPSDTADADPQPDVTPTAVDAGLDQSKVVVEDGAVNETLAADAAADNDDDADAPKRRKRS